MIFPKKKPSLGEVTASPMDDLPEEDDEADDGSYGAAVDELAEVLNVPDDKLEAFSAAFKAAAMSCK